MIARSGRAFDSTTELTWHSLTRTFVLRVAVTVPLSFVNVAVGSTISHAASRHYHLILAQSIYPNSGIASSVPCVAMLKTTTTMTHKAFGAESD